MPDLEKTLDFGRNWTPVQPYLFVNMYFFSNGDNTGAKLSFCIRLSSYGTLVECGCEKKITQFSNLNASLAVGVPSGVTLKLRLLQTLSLILA